MKKKRLSIAVAACLLALTIAGTSIAYFTDTDQYTNVFTAGDVDITLTEAVAERNDLGHVVIEDATNRIPYNGDATYNPLFPMQSIAKDPRITNVGSEAAFVGAIIDITNTNGDINEVLSVRGAVGDTTAVTAFIKGIDTANADVRVTAIEGGFRVYIIYEDALEGETSANANDGDYVTIFNEIQIPSTWDNEEMAYVNGLKINVKAYATQKAGFNTALDAFTAAFGTEFALTNN